MTSEFKEVEKKSILRSLFLEETLSNLEKIETIITRVSKFTDRIITKLEDEISLTTLLESKRQFLNLLPILIGKEPERKYFTKNNIATAYLAVLNNQLKKENGQITSVLIKKIESLEGITKGKSFTYTKVLELEYWLVKKGFLEKRTKEAYSEKVKDLSLKILEELRDAFPIIEAKSTNIVQNMNILLSKRYIPRLKIESAASVLITTLITYSFSASDKKRIINWLKKKHYTSDVDILKRVYRYRSRIKKANIKLLN
ncbi:MAG: hypothetical protein ACTSQE_12845 [Candidatus Heimdallarchaeaceae archaeon]